jgi:ubiquinone biosynthesis monooxygenase Coq6
MIANQCSCVLRSTFRVLRQTSNRRFYSQSSLPPDTYDVVCVGGGPAGLTLLAALRSNPLTSSLKVALVEGQDLNKTILPFKSLDNFSNRCSSLTPASVRFLKGM